MAASNGARAEEIAPWNWLCWQTFRLTTRKQSALHPFTGGAASMRHRIQNTVIAASIVWTVFTPGCGSGGGSGSTPAPATEHNSCGYESRTSCGSDIGEWTFQCLPEDRWGPTYCRSAGLSNSYSGECRTEYRSITDAVDCEAAQRRIQGGTTPTPTASCTTQTTCAACTALANCGWCSSHCYAGTSTGPSGASCGLGAWAWTASQCSAATDPCATHTTCATCTAESSCGWCAGRCFTGTSSGPTNASCGSSPWTWQSRQCP